MNSTISVVGGRAPPRRKPTPLSESHSLDAIHDSQPATSEYQPIPHSSRPTDPPHSPPTGAPTSAASPPTLLPVSWPPPQSQPTPTDTPPEPPQPSRRPVPAAPADNSLTLFP